MFGSHILLNKFAFYCGVPADKNTAKIRILFRCRSNSSMKFAKKAFIAVLELSSEFAQGRRSS